MTFFEYITDIKTVYQLNMTNLLHNILTKHLIEQEIIFLLTWYL